MKDSTNTNPEMEAALQDDLRQRFVLIAQCAAEESADASDETALAAMMMADLVAVAAMFREHSATSERADEIIEFCQQQALPILADTGTEGRRTELVREATNRWSEYLLLLSPEERHTCQSPNGWNNSDENGWGESLAEDQIGSSSDAEDAFEETSVNQRQTPVDMAGILASLSGAGASLAAIEMPSADAVPHPCDNAEPGAPGELETIDDPEMVAAYADDAQQCIAEMEASLLSLESGQNADGALRNFCRQLHTLKGASGTVGLNRLAKYLHDLESDIEQTDESKIDVDRLLACVDAVRGQLSALGISDAGGTLVSAPEQKPVASKPVAAQSDPLPKSVSIASPQQSASVAAASNDNELFVRVEASRLERLMDLLAELVMLRNRRETYVDSLKTIHRELNYCSTRTRALPSSIDIASPQPLPDFTAEGRGPRENSELDSYEFIVPAAKLAAKSRLLSSTLDEIAKDTAELGRSLQEVVDPLSVDNSAVSHLIGRFRQELMELRRLPIGGLFQRLQRVIRDAAKSEGKLVEVHFEGQGARAERAVQDRLFEPLLHLVRNAVSHGIDTPDERSKSGKTPVGRIILSACSDASSLCIEVRDDGNGLNDEALEARGRERGLLPLGEAVSRQQLWKLIFHPGFSTKTSVTEVSGRGVGMDVVDTWVKRLRGRIDVESERGQGTTFRLHIPLRSAVEHAMVVRAGGQLFALPMHAVSGTSNSTRPLNGLTNVAAVGKKISLSQILGCKSTQAINGCCISLRMNGKSSNTAQRGTGSDLMIEVDAIVGVEEVVIRSLPPLLQRNELFAGVTLSGRAETVLLLDVQKVIELCDGWPGMERDNSKSQGLLRSAQSRPGHAVSQNAVSNNPANITPGNDRVRNSKCVLIVDDSVVVRRSLTKTLQAAGYAVREATNGREALSVLNSADIAAVITDLDMPGMTGLELLQEIKRQKHFHAIPVTVLTSRDDESILSEVWQLQPTAILNKPVTAATFNAILETLKMPDSAVC